MKDMTDPNELTSLQIAREFYDLGIDDFTAAQAALDAYACATNSYDKDEARSLWVQAAIRADEAKITPLLKFIQENSPSGCLLKSVEIIKQQRQKAAEFPKKLRPENAHLLGRYDLN